MTRRLLLLRHGQVPPDCLGKFLGSTDVPLDPVGLGQARWMADRIRQFQPQACFCSPMLRCRQTLEALASELPVRFEEDLREIDFGRWEKYTFAEIARESPESAAQWSAFDPGLCFPGGETLGGFLARVRGVAGRLASEPAETALVVAHGGVIRTMICHFLGLPPDRYLAFDISYASLTVLNLFNGRGVLASLEKPEPAENGRG